MSCHLTIVGFPNQLCTLACRIIEMAQVAQNSIMNVKIDDSCAYTQELIGGGKVWILLIKLGPLRCFMSKGMEHSGEYIHRRPTEVVSDTIGDTCIILDFEMELM
jgi:hypothetical protein